MNAHTTDTNLAWENLTQNQKLSLAPLEKHWASLEEINKQKWITIAASYPTLAPSKQARLHDRMTEWASLSKQQRIQARLNFSQAKALSATQKTATWEAYQALSPEEKNKVATAAPKKIVSVATAAKQAASKKLEVIPVTRSAAVELIQLSPSKKGTPIDPHTLLPRTITPQASASKPAN